MTNYGYSGRVLLAAPIETPRSLKSGETVSLAADVHWLVCSDICIPARAHVTLALPVRDSPSFADPLQLELFRETREHWPEPTPASWTVRAQSIQGHFLLSIDTEKREARAVFFPLFPEEIENAAPQIAEPSRRGVRLTLEKSDELTKPISTLKGVLVLGAGRAYEVAAPIANRP